MKFLRYLKGFEFTALIILVVIAGMLFPTYFQKPGGVDLRNKHLLLMVIQLIMFGMGTHMKLTDFTNVGSTGKGVMVGLLCHFSIMPTVGFLLTRLFQFEPEIAAGIILIGSCSSGLASNVMVYMARANLVLSVVVTAMATIAAPILTPLLMKLFANTFIQVSFIPMMMEIIKIVIVPIMAALIHDHLKHASPKQRRLWLMLALSSLLLLMSQLIYRFLPELSLHVLGAICVGFLYNILHASKPSIDFWMPKISMAGILYFCLVTTAAGRDNLIQVGWILFAASIIHNAAGFFFGYWISRLIGMDIPSSRTIAFEVGLQNGGMASGIAASMGKLGTLGLPAAVFASWMNVSGSILANYWRRKTEKEQLVK